MALRGYDQEQMDIGPGGRLRGQPSHVRIPQHQLNRSLRTGVSPSMQQPHNGAGHFQGAPIISNRVPIRRMGPNRGNMFNQFMNRNKQPNLFDRLNHGGFKGGRPNFQHFGNIHPQGNPIMQKLRQKSQGGPFGGVHSDIWTHGINGQPGHGMPPVGGHPPFGPLGPILGHGQTMNGMIQAIMGDLGNGITPDQFAAMQQGNLPGGEHGDFLHALGGGDLNNSPLQALVQHLIQGQAGADGTPGNYMINGNQGGDIAQILRQAIRHNPNLNPPRPPRGLFPGGGLRNRFPGQFQQYPLMMPLQGGQPPQAGLPR